MNSFETRLPLRLGTRASALALAQAEETAATLRTGLGLPPDGVQIVAMTTSGDRFLEGNLSEIGGKGLFTKEIELALLSGHIDLAVHSMKDVATRLPEGLVIPALLPRADVRDVLLCRNAGDFASLPEGSLFGTSSLRRAAQILHLRPDLRIVPMRGNVQTRLKKLGDGMVAATMLAVAGLQRLSLWKTGQYEALDPHRFVPAVGQGAIGLQCRSDDSWMREALARLDHRPTSQAVSAERAMLRVLDGSCRTPIAGFAELAEDGTKLRLSGLIVTPDGRKLYRHDAESAPEDAQALGEALGNVLRHRAGANYVSEFGVLP